MSEAITIHTPATRTRARDDEQDDGITISCLTTAQRNGHSRRVAENCKFLPGEAGGTVGCPNCPYKKRKPLALRDPLQ